MNAEPLVSVVRGTPTDEELAALVTVIAARSITVDAALPRRTPSNWARSARPSIVPPSWRASALPQ
jgi:hypothetical protein